MDIENVIQNSPSITVKPSGHSPKQSGHFRPQTIWAYSKQYLSNTAIIWDVSQVLIDIQHTTFCYAEEKISLHFAKMLSKMVMLEKSLITAFLKLVLNIWSSTES
jgi:hypothetical protein